MDTTSTATPAASQSPTWINHGLLDTLARIHQVHIQYGDDCVCADDEPCVCEASEVA